MRKKLFNDQWEFSKQPFGTDLDAVDSISFSPVNLPHDWLIYQTEALYEDGTGFYRKKFSFDLANAPARTEIYFEGVYMDSSVYVNRKKIGEWKYGYSSFFFDITEALQDGENEILVKIDHRSPNTRWYSGAGIYRNVYLISKEKTSFATDSLYFHAEPISEKELGGTWKVVVQAQLEGVLANTKLSAAVAIRELGVELKGELGDFVMGAAGKLHCSMMVEAPVLWSLEKPQLYTLVLTLFDGEKVVDQVSSRVGFRHYRFDTNQGFFINGEHLKINGVCEHHDLGALGSAYHSDAMRRKLETLRQMGVNAIRTSHNMPAVDLLDLADEMGFLVLDEAFDMWESPKTEYDYARFFKEWHSKDVKSWICRDRNHPCIFMWSIGNEIYDTHKDAHGVEITQMLQTEAREFDPFCNAVIGIGSNYMAWQGAQNCADVLKFAGYNYAERLYDEHHAAHPDWFIFGSETASTLQSRGIYHFPMKQPLLSDDDEQCSSLGNTSSSWGAPNTEYCVIMERDHAFSMGQFLWTGFDYIGEPTPYSTRNSYFGQVDTAGFPKDAFYIYKSAWTDYRKDPFVHLFPYWDFNPGQMIDLRAATNAPFVELFVNGVSLGCQEIDHAHSKKLTGDWQAAYVPGEILAIAYDENHQEIARESHHSFGDAAKLVVSQYHPERPLVAGKDSLAFFSVSAVDQDGYPVENANLDVQVQVSGAGFLAGLDNGDSTDADQYKGYHKRLFSGKMLAIVAAGAQGGSVKIEFSAAGLEGVSLEIPVMDGEMQEGISLLPEVFGQDVQAPEDHWVRKLELTYAGAPVFNPDQKEMVITATVYPESARGFVRQEDLIWKIVDDAGLPSPVAEIVKQEGTTAVVRALGDGEFNVRCMTKNGQRMAKVISQIYLQAKDLGQATLNPYEMIYGGMWTLQQGNPKNGIQHGVAFREPNYAAGYEHIDFGKFGSDEITIPVFEQSSEPVTLEVWEGMPDEEGSELLCKEVYHKPSIWAVYQPETYRLKRRVKGVTTISLRSDRLVNLQGFFFTKQEKAYSYVNAGERDSVYGDSFTEQGQKILEIGNNVSVEFGEIDFGEGGADKLEITGFTPNTVNTIHLMVGEGESQRREIIEFPHTEAEETRSFTVGRITGKQMIRFVFLPGSKFDFAGFQFQACKK